MLSHICVKLQDIFKILKLLKLAIVMINALSTIIKSCRHFFRLDCR